MLQNVHRDETSQFFQVPTRFPNIDQSDLSLESSER